MWRLTSSRRPLPCTPALSWLLESRVMGRVAGSELLIERAGVTPGMRVLDAGCGSGRLTVSVAHRVGPQGEVEALDVRPAALARVQRELAREGLSNVRLVQAALGQGSLETEHFDRALLVAVLGEILDQESALHELYSALKPGGILSVTEVLPDPHYQSRRAVRETAEKVGFRVETTAGTTWAHTTNLVRPPSD